MHIWEKRGTARTKTLDKGGCRSSKEKTRCTTDGGMCFTKGGFDHVESLVTLVKAIPPAIWDGALPEDS